MRLPSRFAALRPILIALASGLASGASVGEPVAVVSAKNPVTSLTRNQVVDIFLGKASRFPDGSPAVPLDQVEGSATREQFYLAFAGKSPAQLDAHWSKIIFTGRGQPPKEYANGAAVKKRLAENASGIGYIDQTLVDATVKVILSE
jgi:ABC-type phosphate transport system substrate-binding protein